MKPLILPEEILRKLDNAYTHLGLTPLGDLALYSYELQNIAALPGFDAMVDKLLIQLQQGALSNLGQFLLETLLNSENKGELKC